MTTILIVDDETIYQKRIFEILNDSKDTYKLLRAFNGVNALEIATKTTPDIIITDWDMPKMNGISLIKELKKSDKLKDIPVIICTGVMTNSAHLQMALEAGAADYIRKPIDEVELIARIKSMLVITEQNQTILRQKQEFFEYKIEIKNRQLASYALILINQERNIKDILLKIREILKTKLPKDANELLRQLVIKLHHETTQNGWDEFRKHFEELHTDFFANISAQFPNLTSNDLKICAFIRLNMTSKNIAKLTNQEPHSVDVARSRLRKKLNLDTDENLYAFICQFG